jgi:EAL domain-containing protein (putative c-di-GMP-specific phosphodiesterase class I)
MSQRQFVADNHDESGTDAQAHLLAERISHLLQEHQLPASLLELEVTETSLMADWEFASQCLLAVRAIGVRIHIDDFGTGHSSLAHLKRLPLDSLKIDRAFVSDLPDGAEDVAVVRAVIALAHSLGFEVIAEGVETAAQHEFLTAAGCDVAQGYHYARPLPPHALATLLRAGSMH